MVSLRKPIRSLPLKSRHRGLYAKDRILLLRWSRQRSKLLIVLSVLLRVLVSRRVNGLFVHGETEKYVVGTVNLRVVFDKLKALQALLFLRSAHLLIDWSDVRGRDLGLVGVPPQLGPGRRYRTIQVIFATHY